MASIVVSGDTSGAVTITAPAIAGTTTLTLPTTSGTLVVTGGAQTIEFADGTVSAPSITNSGDTNTGIFFPAADTIAFTEGGVESMRIDSSGNVGIGTSSPSVRLELSCSQASSAFPIISNNTSNIATSINGIHFPMSNGSSGAQFYIRSDVSGGDYTMTIANGQNQPIRFCTSATTERMRIDGNGNVGIGTTSATTKLTVDTNIANYTDGINLTNSLQWGYGTSINFVVPPTSGGSLATVSRIQQFYEASNQYGLGFSTYNAGLSERMRITSAGDVCINRTSSLGSAKFHVTNASGDANNYVTSLKTNATSVATTMIAFYDGAETFCGQVYVDPSANTTTYATSSDYRLKENVVPISNALAKVEALNPVTYTWKKSGKNGQGFIAHELQEIVPECVIGEKDAVDKEGKILPQMVDTSFLVATLTAAIQELNAKVEAQAAEIQALKGAR